MINPKASRDAYTFCKHLKIKGLSARSCDRNLVSSTYMSSIDLRLLWKWDRKVHSHRPGLNFIGFLLELGT
ncbi:hypothetical protein Pla110_14660 [Polystyrenella longa]|uniref:Uncharacterized protein n=1 Tax=Polystyrenella longa TaxID=2528007 RepID=A0A518CKK3_9PLAN|nr:hypothetical protein Pla110_14660 [Polystyrenella longa]